MTYQRDQFDDIDIVTAAQKIAFIDIAAIGEWTA
jgi:hypothetical protein